MLIHTTRAREDWENRFDWALAAAVGIMLLIGTLAIISAASLLPFYGSLLRKHFLAVLLGLLAFAFGWGLNYQIYEDQWKTLYAGALAMCVGVLVIGVTHKGARAWINLPGFSIEVAEFARVCLLLVTAAYLDRRWARIREPGIFLGVLGLISPVLVLILKQPNFASVLIMFPVFVAMLFCSGTDLRHLLVFFAFGIVVAGLPLLWTWLGLRPEWGVTSRFWAYIASLAHFGWASIGTAAIIVCGLVFLGWLSRQFRLGLSPGFFAAAGLILLSGLFGAIAVNHEVKGYQRKRVEVFLDPDLDPQGAGYNVRQARIALGSGGMWGRGLFSGTQSKLGFLPERHTDFIFAVVGEELGFLGAFSVLGLYLFLVWRAVTTARMARDRFGCLVAVGIATYFAASVLINSGMCLGIFPIAGIPLPFLSYGGSNLVACLWTVGILESIHARRYAFA